MINEYLARDRMESPWHFTIVPIFDPFGEASLVFWASDTILLIISAPEAEYPQINLWVVEYAVEISIKNFAIIMKSS